MLFRSTVAIKEDGTVVAWGWNEYGQCDVPVDLGSVKAISAGTYHTVALKEDGTVVAWGRNHYGICDVPVDLGSVKAVSAGSGHTVALTEDRTVVAWGWNEFGQCDTGNPTPVPSVEILTKEQVVNEFYENKDKFESIVEYAKEYSLEFDRNRIYVRKDSKTNEIEYLDGDVGPIKDDAEYLVNELGYLKIAEITDGEFSKGADIKIIEFLKNAGYGKQQGITYWVNGSFPKGLQPDDYGMELIEGNWYYYFVNMY